MTFPCLAFESCESVRSAKALSMKQFRNQPCRIFCVVLSYVSSAQRQFMDLEGELYPKDLIVDTFRNSALSGLERLDGDRFKNQFKLSMRLAALVSYNQNNHVIDSSFQLCFAVTCW